MVICATVNESPTDATLKLDHSASAESAPDSNSSKVSSKSSSSLPDSENTGIKLIMTLLKRDTFN